MMHSARTTGIDSAQTLAAFQKPGCDLPFFLFPCLGYSAYAGSGWYGSPNMYGERYSATPWPLCAMSGKRTVSVNERSPNRYAIFSVK